MKSRYLCLDFKTGVIKFEVCSKSNHTWFRKKEDIIYFKEILDDWVLQNKKTSEKNYKCQVDNILSSRLEKLVYVNPKNEPKKTNKLKAKKSVISMIPQENDFLEKNNRMNEKSIAPSIKSAISTDALSRIESKVFNRDRSKNCIFQTDR